MINYQQAKNILRKAKIKIKDEEILIKDSLNRVLAKDVTSPSDHPLVIMLLLMGSQLIQVIQKYNKKM